MNRLLEEQRLGELAAAAQKLLANPELEPQVRAQVHNLMCYAYCKLGSDTLDAVLHGQRALRMARRLRDRQLQGEALANYAWACYLAGYFHVVVRTCESLKLQTACLTENSAAARAWQFYQEARAQVKRMGPTPAGD